MKFNFIFTNFIIEKITTESTTDVDQTAEALDSNDAFAMFKANSGKELYFQVKLTLYSNIYPKNPRFNFFLHSSLCSIKKSIAATKSKIQKISSEINNLVDEISSKSTLESKPAKYLTEAEFHERVTLAEMKNSYIELKKQLFKHQDLEIDLEKQLATTRSDLISDFLKQYPNDEISRSLEKRPEIETDDQQPPFQVPKDEDSENPSFSAWRVAKRELDRVDNHFSNTISDKRTPIFK